MNGKNQSELFDFAAELYAIHQTLASWEMSPHRAVESERLKTRYEQLVGLIAQTGGSYRMTGDMTGMSAFVPVVFDADGKPFPYSIGHFRFTLLTA